MAFTWSQLHEQLRHSVSRGAAMTRFRTMTAVSPVLSRFGDPGAVFEALHGEALPPDKKNTVLRHLVRLAQRNDELADVATAMVLLALWPGLDAVYGRLWRWSRHDPERLAADLIGQATIQVKRSDLARIDRVAATVVRNVERDLCRQSMRRSREDRARAECAEAGILGISGIHCDPATVAVEDQFAVRQAVERLGETGDLVVAVAVGGETRKAAGAQLGLDHEAARKRYQRALKAARQCL